MISVNGERSDREQMRNIYDFCRRYADNFKKGQRQPVFTGATGLQQKRTFPRHRQQIHQ